MCPVVMAENKIFPSVIFPVISLMFYILRLVFDQVSGLCIYERIPFRGAPPASSVKSFK